jgi:hypothetical protein
VSVYVDACEWPYGRMMMCHMIADDVDALHAMADRIGVARRWFQYARYPHYDICKSKRALAVKFGAIEIGRREFVSRAHVLIEQHQRPAPPTERSGP